MVYRAQKSRGPLLGLVAGILLFAFVFWGIDYGLKDDMVLKVALYLPAVLFAMVFVYLIIGAFNMKYIIAEDGLILVWGAMRKKVPWNEVNEVFNVKGEANLFPFLSTSWPGYIAGLYTFKGFGPVRMFGTNWEEGFVYIKTKQGFFGFTPEDPGFADAVAAKNNLEVQVINMDEVPRDVKGKSLKQDNVFSMYYKMNLIALAVLCLYVAIFYPGSSAPEFIVLLVVLAIALFFFNVSNAARLVQFSEIGGYLTLLVGVAVTGAFIIMSFATIHLNL